MSLKEAIIESAKHLALLSAAITILAGVFVAVVWQGLRSPAQDLVQDLAATDKVVAAIEGVAEEQIEQRAVLETLVVRVDRLEPDPPIAMYDKLRSTIDATCDRGAVCHWTYLVRRTDYGAPCGQPRSNRVLRDAAGINFFPPAAPPAKGVTRLNREWTRVSGAFVVPMEASLGVAEFYLALVYSKCGRDRNMTVRETSLPLVLHITEDE